MTVEPNAFLLQGNSDPAPNVTMLCNAFKATYMTMKVLQGGAGAGLAAKTPYVQQSRTPNPCKRCTPRSTCTTAHFAYRRSRCNDAIWRHGCRFA